MLLPSLPYDVLMDFDWQELKSWHGRAIETYKAMRGIS